MTLTAHLPAPGPTADAPARAVRPRWITPAYWAMLAGTAVLYLWGLGSAGWGNDFYAAAAQAGTQNAKAWLFGSLDAGNAITVDKPPAAMWLMGLFGRLFGFGSFTVLLPQALAGIATVALLYATVKRTSGPVAGLLAGTALAVTPVAASMFRFDNPDALLVLLLVAAAYCTVRAVEDGRIRWMALTGAIVGLAFLTKMLQAFLPVPGLALAFLVAAPLPLWTRVRGLLVAGGALVLSAGWYVALVELWPSGSRPYIAGSTDDSLMQLALGYNGIERITGGEGGPGHGGHPGPGGPGGGANLFFGGEPGITRLFGPSMGAEASWLLPAALIGLVAGVGWLSLRSARTDRLRAGLLLWGGWLLVTGAVFSFMDGTVHPYYTVALAPAVAALVGISVAELSRRRNSRAARLVLAAQFAATGVWAFALLDRTPQWQPWLRWSVLALALLAAAAVLAIRWGARSGRPARVRAAVGAGVVVAALLSALGGPLAFAVYDVTHPSGGPGIMAGPGQHDPFGGPGGPGGRGGWHRDDDDAALRALLTGVDARWAAAGIGSMSVSGLELRTGASLMAIGGFSGGDPSPTLEQFQRYVADGSVRYFLAEDRGGRPHGRDGTAQQIQSWVQEHFTKLDVGGATVYDLRSPRAAP